jgi:hypothetical protein
VKSFKVEPRHRFSQSWDSYLRTCVFTSATRPVIWIENRRYLFRDISNNIKRTSYKSEVYLQHNHFPHFLSNKVSERRLFFSFNSIWFTSRLDFRWAATSSRFFSFGIFCTRIPQSGGRSYILDHSDKKFRTIWLGCVIKKHQLHPAGGHTMGSR